MTFSLVDEVLDVLAEEGWGKVLFRLANRAECTLMTQPLLEGTRRKVKLHEELARDYEVISELAL